MLIRFDLWTRQQVKTGSAGRSSHKVWTAADERFLNKPAHHRSPIQLSANANNGAPAVTLSIRSNTPP